MPALRGVGWVSVSHLREVKEGGVDLGGDGGRGIVPIGWDQAAGEVGVERGVGPVGGTVGVAVLDGVKVDVVDVGFQIVLVAEGVF